MHEPSLSMPEPIFWGSLFKCHNPGHHAHAWLVGLRVNVSATIPSGTGGLRRMNSILNMLGAKKASKLFSSHPKTSAAETGQMSAAGTGQMSAAETRQMSSAETGQMQNGETGQRRALPIDICLVSADDIRLASREDMCLVPTAEICPVSTEDV